MAEPPWPPGTTLAYSHLHLLLAVPTIIVLGLGGTPPLHTAPPLMRRAGAFFLCFILCIAFVQASVWDNLGSQIGIWRFNPAKVTAVDLSRFGVATELPLEEILWLVHHVVMAALCQMRCFDWLRPSPEALWTPPRGLQLCACAALVAAFASGVWALCVSPDPGVKCLGLVASFFIPVLALLWLLGAPFWRRHARRFLAGWLVPSLTTICIDCLGQQQGVWRFPPDYLSGLNIGAYLKLDIALVYGVSTLAVTGTGAILLAAAEDLTAELELSRARAQPAAAGSVAQLLRFIAECAAKGLTRKQKSR